MAFEATAPARNADRPNSFFDDIARFPLWPSALLTAAISFLLAPQFFAPVWTHGSFGDPDDAMRMVQVRDLLAGQSWFDMTTYRLDPGHGHFIHWSRIVDVPLALLLKLFGLALEPELAERAMRIAYPVLMLTLMFAGAGRCANALMGRAAMVPALATGALAAFAVGQFQLGRIDHHSMQIVLLVFMLAFSVEALERPAQAMKAAATGALSLGVSVENLPFIAVMSAVWPILWALHGQQYVKHLRLFNGSMLISALLVFAGTVSPSRWVLPGCDAYTSSYLAPLLVGGAGMFCASFAGNPSRTLRFALALGTGCVAVAAMALHSPACFGSPLAQVDPLVRGLWLDNVSEARPLLSSLRLDPESLPIVGSTLFCALLGLMPIWFETGRKRLAWLITGGFILAGLAAALWQVRAVSSLQPLGLLGAAWLIHSSGQALLRKGGSPVLALGLILPLSATGWATAAVLADKASGKAATSSTAANANSTKCTEAASYQTLRALPKGVILSPLDIGAHVQVYTHHAVIAAGYHRNNRGNRLSIETFTASSADAAQLVAKSGAAYVVTCPGLSELDLLKRMNPSGFAAELGAGVAMPWLDKVSAPGDGLTIYRVK